MWTFFHRKVISLAFASGTPATAQGEISLYGCLLTRVSH